MARIKIQFDPDQEHQIEAVDSVVNLFDGLFRADTGGFELGDEVSPNLPPYIQLDLDWLRENLNAVQESNKLSPDLSVTQDSGFMVEGVSPDTWVYPTFTVEMETGTGKTYVYLRTIYELFKHYGLKKYIIIVPSVAIYEGVLKSFSMTREHFKALYGNENATMLAYDGSKLTLLKNFAVGKDIEILVMTVDSFNKQSNTIFKKTDKLMGERYPYQYLQETRPILILDESQNYRTEKARAALRTLKPLLALSYSATPGKEARNRLYKLTPFQAFQRNLVKRIEVMGMIEAQNTVQHPGYLHLLAIEKKGRSLSARVQAMVMESGSLVDRELDLGPRVDLAVKSGNPAYAGYAVEEINQKEGFLAFANGERVSLLEERLVTVSREALFRRQIEETIRTHFDKQRELKSRGIKVLTLFFIDRVANYTADEGIIRTIFDETFERLKKNESDFARFEASQVREGYFARKKATKKEPESYIDTAIDESAKTAADREAEKSAYELIMKQKERLLSFDEPVAFIFAHSALREGWDNPNVFQICALREITSEKQRRQTIGRGLRLPVNQAGERLFDRRLNTLTVVANESYANYVKNLQTEYAETDEELKVIPANAAEKQEARRNDHIFKSRDFINFWNKLIQRTEYTINIDRDEYIARAVHKINTTAFPEPHVVITRGEYIITKHRLELVEVESGEAWIRITREDSRGGENSTKHCFKTGDDLSKLLKNPLYKPFKITRIEGEGESGRVGFSGADELTKDRPILFSSEQGQSFSTRHSGEKIGEVPKFNLIERTVKELSLTRETVLAVFKGINKRQKEAFLRNPEGFSGLFIPALKEVLAEHVADRIEYTVTQELIERDTEEMFPETKLFPTRELAPGNGESSVYDLVQCDSEVEFHFVEKLNADEQVVLYFKFPPTFKIRIPRIIGNYNPDWGILRWQDDHPVKMELVRETKGTINLDQLQHTNESRKIRCARKHFGKLGIDYRHVTDQTTDYWRMEVREGEPLFKAPKVK